MEHSKDIRLDKPLSEKIFEWLSRKMKQQEKETDHEFIVTFMGIPMHVVFILLLISMIEYYEVISWNWL